MSGFEESIDHPNEPTKEKLLNNAGEDRPRWPTWASLSSLIMALLAAGVGPGDEVITAASTFVATAAAIDYTGARPVFADINPDTLNLDANAAHAWINSNTKAILPVQVCHRMEIPCS